MGLGSGAINSSLCSWRYVGLAWDLATSSNGATSGWLRHGQPFLCPSHRPLPAEARLYHAVLNINLLPIPVRGQRSVTMFWQILSGCGEQINGIPNMSAQTLFSSPVPIPSLHHTPTLLSTTSKPHAFQDHDTGAKRNS